MFGLGKNKDLRNCDREKSVKSYKQSGVVKSIEIMANKGACDTCMKRNGQIVTFEEAGKNPLPTPGCTGEYGCRCTVLPVIDELPGF